MTTPPSCKRNRCFSSRSWLRTRLSVNCGVPSPKLPASCNSRICTRDRRRKHRCRQDVSELRSRDPRTECSGALKGSQSTGHQQVPSTKYTVQSTESRIGQECVAMSGFAFGTLYCVLGTRDLLQSGRNEGEKRNITPVAIIAANHILNRTTTSMNPCLE